MIEKLKKKDFQNLHISVAHLKGSLPHIIKGYFMTSQDKWALIRVLKEYEQKSAKQPTNESGISDLLFASRT